MAGEILRKVVKVEQRDLSESPCKMCFLPASLPLSDHREWGDGQGTFYVENSEHEL